MATLNARLNISLDNVSDVAATAHLPIVEKDWSKGRSSYEYIPAKMVAVIDEYYDFEWGDLKLKVEVPDPSGWNLHKKRKDYSSIQLDNFHTSLLMKGMSIESRLHGLCSTVFWGYASGTDGKVHVGRALARLGWLKDGKNYKRLHISPQGLDEIHEKLNLTAQYVDKGDFENALLAAMSLKFIGMSFASKLVMFMSPDFAAVYDDVIYHRLASSTDDELRSLAIKTSGVSPGKQAKTYKRWCDYCCLKAKELNNTDGGHRWIDWNGSEQKFRAVDVERAFFSLGR